MGRLPPDEMLRPATSLEGLYAEADSGCIPVGITEIAKRHGTTPGTIRSWRHRHADFPKPIAELAMGPLWDWREVEKWLRTRR